MAYNPTPPPPPSNNKGELPTGKSPIMEKPFVEAVDPTPSPILGEIKFIKTIYSQDAFRQSVDTSISELVTQRETIDIQQFFDQYHQIFFDIPQKGINSHENIIRESMDYVNDFTDYKDEQILDLENQIIALNNEILELQQADLEGEADDISEDIEAQAQQQKALAEIGDPSNPNIYWSNDSTRLLFPDGLKKVGKHMQDDNDQLLPNGADVFEGNKNKIDNSWKDLKQAYEKGGDGNIREFQEVRTYSEWKADINKRGDGAKRKANCMDCLDYVRDIVKQTYEDITS
tara:strand:- start:962 stop:1825 length:864 start_codon:yes stop_codon:yes gene_type:complete